MAIARALTVFLVIMGLSFGAMTANALAAKQTFAKPCPMEQSGKKGECPCCKDHCDSAMLSCSGKCPSSQGAATLASSTYKLAAVKLLFASMIAPMSDQFANGPAPPVPIV